MLFLFLFSLLSSFKVGKKLKNVKLNRLKFNARPLRVFFLILFLVLFLGMVKILPVLEQLDSYDRCVDDYSNVYLSDGCYEDYADTKEYAITFPNLINSFLVDDHINHSTMFVGIIPLLFFMLSLLFLNKKVIKYASLFFLMAILILGPHFFVDFYWLIWKLPFFHSVNKISKYLAPLILFSFSIVVGAVVPALKRSKQKRNILFNLALLLLITFSIGNQFYYNIQRQSGLFDVVPPVFVKEEGFYQTYVDNVNLRYEPFLGRIHYYNLKRGVGTINWYGSILLDENTEPKYFVSREGVERDNPQYKGETYFLNENNQAQIDFFSTNKLIISTNISLLPDSLIVNQNYNKYWRANCGIVVDNGGLLAIELTEDCGPVELRFIPYSFIIGFIITLAANVVFSLVFIKFKSNS